LLCAVAEALKFHKDRNWDEVDYTMPYVELEQGEFYKPRLKWIAWLAGLEAGATPHYANNQAYSSQAYPSGSKLQWLQH
jgi:hypothetical protein